MTGYKRYALFGGSFYYPSGGWRDFVDAFEDIDQIDKTRALQKYDWAEIVDLENLKSIWRKNRK